MQNPATDPKRKAVAVVIPAWNERDSLPLVLAALPDGQVDRVVVVDNGSSDGTGEIAARLGADVVSEPRRGYGSACLAGVARLRASPPDVLVFLDGDFSDRPEELPRLLAPIGAGADLVIGSRTRGRRDPGALLPQARLGNALACGAIRLLTGHRFTDLGPFRAMRWEAYERLGMSDTTFGWTCEMQIKAVRRGLKVVEVPVSYRRRVGKSKITGTLAGSVRAGARILWTIARHARR
jgi:glycosyltransferase involved in cell wall biosynthesis